MFFLSDFSPVLQSSVSGLLESKPDDREGLTVPKVRLGWLASSLNRLPVNNSLILQPKFHIPYNKYFTIKDIALCKKKLVSHPYPVIMHMLTRPWN